MKFKQKYALTEPTMRGEHGAYQNRIVSLHKSHKAAMAAKQCYGSVIELVAPAKVGDRINIKGELAPESVHVH